MRLLTSWLLALLATSCVPFIVPPARAELGAGTAEDSLPGTETSDSNEIGGTVLARAGLHPLQLAPKLANRVVDVGIGYGVEGVQKTSMYRSGPYAEVAAFPMRGSAGRGHRWRAGVLVLGEYSTSRNGALGDGSVLFAGTAELTGFSNGAFETDDTVGLAYGEWGIGLFAGPSLRIGTEQTPWMASAGLTARIPAALGLACCLKPDVITDGKSPRARRGNKQRHPAKPSKWPLPRRR